MIPGDASGRHRLQARNPARCAAAAVGRNWRFDPQRRAGRTAGPAVDPGRLHARRRTSRRTGRPGSGRLGSSVRSRGPWGQHRRSMARLLAGIGHDSPSGPVTPCWRGATSAPRRRAGRCGPPCARRSRARHRRRHADVRRARAARRSRGERAGCARPAGNAGGGPRREPRRIRGALLRGAARGAAARAREPSASPRRVGRDAATFRRGSAHRRSRAAGAASRLAASVATVVQPRRDARSSARGRADLRGAHRRRRAVHSRARPCRRRRGLADRHERHHRIAEARDAHPREPAGRRRRDARRPARSQPHDVLLTPFPLCHVAGYNVFVVHRAARPVVLMRRFDPARLAELVRRAPRHACSRSPRR